MNKRIRLLAFVSLLLVVALSVESSLSYFYTYTEAKGQFNVSLNDESEIEEPTPEIGIKHLIIESTGKDPIFVRVHAFAPKNEIYDLKKESMDAGWSFNSSDGFYYYDQKLDSGQSIDILFDIDLPEDAKAGEEYNVVLVYEATPALYSPDRGWYADWNKIIPPGTAIVEEGN